MTGYTFNQLFDFTRTTSATFVGSNGLIQTTAASRNLLTYTQEFDNGVWTKTNTTVTANSTVAPDGTSTADTLTAGAGAGAGQQTYQTLSNLGSGTYVYSIYVKQGSGATDSNNFGIRNQTTSTSAATITIDYATGAITQTTGTGATAASVGNGWWRIVIPFALSATVGDAIRFFAGSSGQVETPGEFVYAWGAQVEVVPDGNLVLGSELRGGGVVSTLGSPSPLATYNPATGAATLNRVDGSNVSGVRIPVPAAGRAIRVSVTITSTSGVAVQVRGTNPAGTVLSTISSVAGTYLVYVVSDTTDIYLTMGGNASTGSITINSVNEITGVTGAPTTYTRNNGGVYPARFDYDPVTLAPKGILIEEQRTNLMRYSDQFDNAAWNNASPNIPTVTTNTTVAPDGTTTADTLTAATGGTSSQARQVSGPTGTTGNFTGSIFLKAGTSALSRILLADTTAGFNVVGDFKVSWTGGVAVVQTVTSGTATVTAAGNGWYRCVLTANVPSANASVSFAVFPDNVSGTGSVIAWGAQLEAGSFATSYIPTVASQVTRTADRCDIVAPNFAPWYNQSQGTFVAEFSGNGSYAVVATDGTTNNYNGITYNSPTSVRGVTVAAGVFAGVTMTGGAAGTVTKTAYGYKVNDLAGSTNGGAVVANATAAIPTLNQLLIGTYGGFGQLNGHIRNIKYYPFRASNNQLQALST